MIAIDHLRPPSAFDPTAPAYKEWLHIIVFDHATGAVALINTSLHGAPGDARSRAVGVGLVDVPGVPWVGNTDVVSVNETAVDANAIRMRRLAVSIDTTKELALASVRLPDHGFVATLRGRLHGPAVGVPHPIPIGAGWMGWYAIPRLTVDGELALADRTISLDGSAGYCDHNWGRWRWGEIGWDWGAFLAADEGPAVVFSQVNGEAGRRAGAARMHLRVGRTRRTFVGASVAVEASGLLAATLRRLPGAMAALHSDRATPRLPRTVRIVAADGADRIELEFNARAAAQVILSETSERGYGFLHELTGSFRCSGTVGGAPFVGEGLGVMERAE